MRHERRSIRPLRLALIPALAVAVAVAVTAPLAAQDAAADRDYAARMHREHAQETPTPSAAVAPAPAQKLVVQEVEYATIGGQKVRGHLARPLEASGPLPGLIVIQEWWGLNDNIRAMADRFAGEGYLGPTPPPSWRPSSWRCCAPATTIGATSTTPTGSSSRRTATRSCCSTNT